MCLRIEKAKEEALSEFSSIMRFSNSQAKMKTSNNLVSTIASFPPYCNKSILKYTSATVPCPRKFESPISYFYQFKNYSRVKWVSSILTEAPRSYEACLGLNGNKAFNWSKEQNQGKGYLFDHTATLRNLHSMYV